MRKENTVVATVGELLAYLADVPPDTPIGRLTQGYYVVNKIGDVSVFVDNLPLGREGRDGNQVILRISA